MEGATKKMKERKVKEREGGEENKGSDEVKKNGKAKY